MLRTVNKYVQFVCLDDHDLLQKEPGDEPGSFEHRGYCMKHHPSVYIWNLLKFTSLITKPFINPICYCRIESRKQLKHNLRSKLWKWRRNAEKKWWWRGIWSWCYGKLSRKSEYVTSGKIFSGLLLNIKWWKIIQNKQHAHNVCLFRILVILYSNKTILTVATGLSFSPVS